MIDRSMAIELFQWGFLWKFFSVGAFGAVLDNALLVVLVEFIHVDPLYGKIVSAESSIVFMFLINEFWTFSDYGEGSLVEFVRRLFFSNFIRLGGLVVGLITMYILMSVLDIWYLLSNILGIGVGFVVNYTCECIFTWGIVSEEFG